MTWNVFCFEVHICYINLYIILYKGLFTSSIQKLGMESCQDPISGYDWYTRLTLTHHIFSWTILINYNIYTSLKYWNILVRSSKHSEHLKMQINYYEVIKKYLITFTLQKRKNIPSCIIYTSQKWPLFKIERPSTKEKKIGLIVLFRPII